MSLQKIFSIFLMLLLSVALHASDLRAYFMHASFNTADKGPYLETYLLVMGNTVNFKKEANEKFIGKLEVHMEFLSKGQKVYEDNYNLLSPEIADTSEKRPSFIDQQRIPLPEGEYEFVLKIRDANS